MQRRHVALGSLAALAVGAHQSSSANERRPVELFGLAGLPSVNGHPEVDLYRIVLAPGASWALDYPGPLQITVESGTMEVPEFGERLLTGTTDGGHSECPEPQIHGNTFGCWSGFYSETGSFGSLTNVGEDNLSIMVLVTKPPDGEMVTPTA